MNEVTFIIKSFKRHECVRNLVESIKQFYPDNKILICNDDGEELEVDGATVFNTDFDIGLSAGRNLLVSKVKTKYFVLLDDDFLFTDQTKIELLLEDVETHNLDLCGGALLQEGQIVHYEGIYKYTDGHLVMLNKKNEERLYDFVFNFFLARTETFRKHKWDNELKLAEHTAFFFSNKGKLRINYRPDVVIRHLMVRDDEYGKYRWRANAYIHRFMKKYGIKTILNIAGVKYNIDDYAQYKL